MACLVAAGCGGGSGTTGGSTAGGRSTAGTAPSPTTPGGTGAGGQGRLAIQEPVQSRGIKGEDPTAEAATKAHISPSDCVALQKLAEARLGTKLARRSVPSPPLSRCGLNGPGTSVNVYLDSGFAANRRYHNRIEETVQFNYENPAGVPHPVPHVGEKAAYDADASFKLTAE